MKFLDYLNANYHREFIDKFLDEKYHQYKGLIFHPQKVNAEILIKELPFLIKHPDVNNGFIYHKKYQKEVTNSYLYHLGAYYIQDPSAMVVAQVLPKENYQYILDMCASPGGKTIALAINNLEAIIVSNDRSYQRAKIIEYNVAKMGLDNVAIISQDFRHNPKKYQGIFDAIILDAPCSGSLMAFKEEKMQLDWSIEKVYRQKKIQGELLEVANLLLKENGYLIYSTCSLSKEENEDNLLHFLNDHHYRLIDLTSIKNSSASLLKGAIYLYPYHYKGEGQFITLMQKKEKGPKQELKKYKNIINENKLSIIREYSLLNRYNFFYKDNYYSLNKPFDPSYFMTLRPGIPLYDKSGHLSLHFTRFLDPKYGREIQRSDLQKYLQGYEIENTYNYDEKTKILKFQNLNIMSTKLVNNKFKNYYPKSERKLINFD